MKKIGLLGVMKTMEGKFYRQKFNKKNIKVCVPESPDKEEIHERIISELVLGKFTESTRNKFVDVCLKLYNQGAQGIIMGCTEIPLLMKGVDQLPFPLFSTTEIHCTAIVEAAIR